MPDRATRIRELVSQGLTTDEVYRQIKDEEGASRIMGMPEGDRRAQQESAAGLAPILRGVGAMARSSVDMFTHPLRTAKHAISGVTQMGLDVAEGVPRITADVLDTAAPRSAERLRGFADRAAAAGEHMLAAAGPPEQASEVVPYLAGYIAPFVAAPMSATASIPGAAGRMAAVGADAALSGAAAASAPENSLAGMAAEIDPAAEGWRAGVRNVAETLTAPLGGLETVAANPALRAIPDAALAGLGALPDAFRTLRGMDETGAAVGPVSRETPRVPGQVDTGMQGTWFSRLERAIEQAPQERATGEQWLGMIKKPGQAGTEMEWTGIEAKLRERGAEPLTRSDVLALARERPVQLKDVQRGGAEADETNRAFNEHNEDFVAARNRLHYEIADDTGQTFLEFRNNYLQPLQDGTLSVDEAARRIAADVGSNGGTLRPDFADDLRAYVDLYQEGQELRRASENYSPAQFGEYTVGSYGKRPEANYREIDVTAPDVERFSGAHSGTDPKAIVRLRLTDRTVNGEKTLFLEEIQSDRHQRGRTQGYDETAKADEASRELAQVRQEIRSLNNELEVRSGSRSPPVRDWKSYYDRLGVLGTRENELRGALNRASGQVPDAPFKKTDEWVGLAVRRALQEAASGGYDRLSWVSGAQAADLYDLRKQVERINYDPRTKQLEAVGPDGEIVAEEMVNPEDLADHIGKGPAQRLLEQQKDLEALQAEYTALKGQFDSMDGGAYYDWKRDASPEKVAVYDKMQALRVQADRAMYIEGDDLAVGGEGMTSFYDQIVPGVVKKEAKRLGLEIEPIGLDLTDYGARGRQPGDASYPPAAPTNLSIRITPRARDMILNEGQRIGATPGAPGITGLPLAGARALVGAGIGAGAAGGQEGGLSATEGAVVGGIAGIVGMGVAENVLRGLPGTAAFGDEVGGLALARRPEPKSFTVTHENVSEGVHGVFRAVPPEHRGRLTEAVEQALAGGESGDLLVDVANRVGGTSVRVIPSRGVGVYNGQVSPNVLLQLEGAERADVERIMALRGMATGQDAEAAFRLVDETPDTYEAAEAAAKSSGGYWGMTLTGDVDEIVRRLAGAGVDATADVARGQVHVIDFGGQGVRALEARVAEAVADVITENYPRVFEGLYVPRQDYARAIGDVGAFEELARLLDERITPAYQGLANELGFGAGDDLTRLQELSARLRRTAEPTPGRGLYEKGPGSKKVPRPAYSEVDRRLKGTEERLDYLEASERDPWKPTARGVFVRDSDPGFQRLAGTSTMPAVRGAKRPGLTQSLTSERVASIIDRQVKLGLPQGGEGFYNLAPIANSIDEMNAPKNSFEDFAVAGSIGSIQNPIMGELSNASILMYAKANGISVEQATEEFFRRYPDAPRPFLTGAQAALWDKYLASGAFDPTSATSGSRKAPAYMRHKLGESVETAVLDTHEQKATLFPTGNERMIDQMTGAEYEQVSDAVYGQGAERLGVTTGQYQAGRWIGGGPLTGLKSPRGDYVQHLEDSLLYTALTTGKDATARGLSKLWEDVVNGRDFLLPFYGKGAPVTPGGTLTSTRRRLQGVPPKPQADITSLPERIRKIVTIGRGGHLATPAKGSKQGLELGNWWSEQTGKPLAEWNEMTKAEQDLQVVQIARAEKDVRMGGPGTIIGDRLAGYASDVEGPGLPTTLEERRASNVLIPGMRLRDESGYALPGVVRAVVRAGVGATVGAAVAPEDQELLGATARVVLSMVGGAALAGQGDTLRRIMSWRKAGLLSSPSTTVMNVTSTGTSVAAEALKDAPAAAWDWILSGMTGIRSKDGLSASTLRASWDAVGDGIEQAKKLWKEGESPTDMAKWDRVQIKYDSPIVQKMHDAVYNVLGAQDRFFHTVAAARSLQEQANVIAKEAFNRRGITGLDTALHFSDWREMATWLQKNPTADMALRAESDAAMAVFRNQDGLLANAAKGLREAFVDAGPDAEAVFDLFLPFTTTPANVVSRVAEYSPLGFLGAARDAGELRRMVEEGASDLKPMFDKQRKVSDRLGRATLGSGVVALGAWLAHRNLMSPGYPQDSPGRNVQRITERAPGAIRIAGRDYPIERLAPFGPLLTMGAELYHGARSGGKGSAVARGLGYLGGTVTNESFLGDVDGALGVLSGEGSLGDRAAQLGSDVAASFVPNIVRRSLAGYDPTVREVRRPSPDEPATLLDRAQTAIPGLRQQMPARVDPLGETVSRGEGGVAGAAAYLFNPFSGQLDLSEDDPLRATIEEYGASIPSADDSIRNLGVQKGTHEFEELARIYGGFVRSKLEAVQQDGMEMDVAGERKLVTWDEATPAQRQLMLERSATNARGFVTRRLQEMGLYAR